MGCGPGKDADWLRVRLQHHVLFALRAFHEACYIAEKHCDNMCNVNALWCIILEYCLGIALHCIGMNVCTGVSAYPDCNYTIHAIVSSNCATKARDVYTCPPKLARYSAERQYDFPPILSR